MPRKRKVTRLEFDDELMKATLGRPNRPRRVVPRLAFATCLLAVVGIAYGGTDYLPWHWWPGSSEAAVACTCNAIVEAMQNDSPAALEPLCADGAAGKAMLAEYNDRLIEDGKAVHAAALQKPAPALESPAAISCYGFLESVRRQLARPGSALPPVTPVAFGGIEANVIDTAAMSSPAESVTGELYFQAGAQMYALEFTARVCGDTAVVTSFWRLQPVDAPAEELKTFSEQRYPAALAPQSGSTLAITNIRHIFIPLAAGA